MIKLKLESYKGGREETERDTHTENEKKGKRERKPEKEGGMEGGREDTQLDGSRGYAPPFIFQSNELQYHLFPTGN